MFLFKPGGRRRPVHPVLAWALLAGILGGTLAFAPLRPAAAGVPTSQRPSPEPASAADALEHQVGQMIMAGFRGTDLEPGHPFLEDLKECHLGGVILFDYDVALRSPLRNIVSPGQVKRLIRQLQAGAAAPLLVGVDQEGGQVRRLKEKHGFPPSPSQAFLGREDREDLTRAEVSATAALLADLGFNVDFAPVLDLALNPENPVIAAPGRSYGSDVERVVRHGVWAVEELRARGILAVVKHFPGHGSSREDSHLGLPDVSRVWQARELEPFRRVIRQAAPEMVMTAHLYNSGWDAVYPATLSRAVISGILRGDLGFEGVVVSDDLQMGAIQENFSLRSSIRLAVNAGVDLLLFANNLRYDPRIVQKAHSILMDLVETGEIPRDRIEASYGRLQRLKRHLRAGQ